MCLSTKCIFSKHHDELDMPQNRKKTTTKNIVKWHVHTYILIYTHSIPISQNKKKKVNCLLLIEVYLMIND